MGKKGLPVTETQRKEESRKLNRYMALLTGVVCGYLGGYATTIMEEEQMSLLPEEENEA